MEKKILIKVCGLVVVVWSSAKHNEEISVRICQIEGSDRIRIPGAGRSVELNSSREVSSTTPLVTEEEWREFESDRFNRRKRKRQGRN